jgi:hypothetical protein
VGLLAQDYRHKAPEKIGAGSSLQVTKNYEQEHLSPMVEIIELISPCAISTTEAREISNIIDRLSVED